MPIEWTSSSLNLFAWCELRGRWLYVFFTPCHSVCCCWLGRRFAYGATNVVAMLDPCSE